jgi:hypothetical protein
MKKGDRVLIDTMVIIEAHRLSCWSGIRDFFSLETIEQCVIECATGNRLRTGYVPVDGEKLGTGILVHPATEAMRTTLVARDPRSARLDPGERDLLAFALSLAGAWLLCAPDKAAILSAHRLNWLDRVVALEEMALVAGLRKQGYGLNHTKRWLREFKTKIQLGMV